MERIACYFALIPLALGSSLKLPLLRSSHSSHAFLERLSYLFLLLASLSLSVSFFFKWQAVGWNNSSLHELGFVVFCAWIGSFTLPFLKFLKSQWLTIPLITLILIVHLISDWSRVHTGTNLESTYLAVHIVGAIVGEVLAIIAAGIASLYLLQHRFLKEKSFAHLLRKLPALEVLDECLIAALGAGFLFLSVALISGAIFLFRSESTHYRHFIVKLIWASSVCFWYFVALFSRMILHFSTKNLAQMSVVGFCLLVGAYFGFIF